jgi:general secretion pathway protein G
MREATLKEDLYLMRDAISQYTKDKKKAPQDLDALVRTGYLRYIPKDPFTGSNNTWQVVQEDLEDLTTVSPMIEPGITNVLSGSQLISSEGTPYSSW